MVPDSIKKDVRDIPGNSTAIKYEDIHLKDIEVRNQFLNYFNSEDYANALKLLSDNYETLFSKTFSDEPINGMQELLSLIQNLYNDNSIKKLERSQNIFQLLYIDNFKYIGEYDTSIEYYPRNFVLYQDLIYLCVNETSGGEFNPADWQLIGLKGDKGDYALDCILFYKWSSTLTYPIRAVVSFENVLYISKVANTNKKPDISPNEWDLFLSFPKAKITVSSAQPTAQVTGDIWWEILN